MIYGKILNNQKTFSPYFENPMATTDKNVIHCAILVRGEIRFREKVEKEDTGDREEKGRKKDVGTF